MTVVKTTLREYIDAAYEHQQEVDTGRLCRSAYRKFKDDPEFMAALAREAIFLLVPSIAEDVRRSRRLEREPDETTRARLERVFAHVGETRHRSVLSMTRPDHLFAAEERKQMARGNLLWAEFHQDVANRLPNDTVTTGDCLTDDQLDSIYSAHFE